MNPIQFTTPALDLPPPARLVAAWCDLAQPNDRAEIAAAQHESLRAALKHLFAGDELPLFTLRDLRITHTPLGQPRVLRTGPLAAWGKETGVKAEDLHVSFTHDGGRLLTLLGSMPGLRGLGVDLVHTPRLARPGKDREYLHRFARRSMSDAEYGAFVDALPDDSIEVLRERVAMAFALKEAASKALGTGLLLGLGLGNAQSVAIASLCISWREAEPDLDVVGDGAAALKRIRARRVVCAARVEGEFAVAEVAALR